MFYLTSCSIVKNEDKYIDEFVAVHEKLGVEHFLFFDRSLNPLKKHFAGKSNITVIDFPEPNRHAEAWCEGIKYFTNKSKWVQFVDIDQVVVPMKTKDIKVMLQPYESYGSLGLNWHSFGSSGHEKEPTESTYISYTKRCESNAGINSHIQSIVQPDKCVQRKWDDPHHPPLKQGNIQVNEKFQSFTGPFNKPSTQDVGFIAHYYTRSREYWAAKIAKMRADTGTIGGSLSDFDHHQTYMNKVEDLTVKNIWTL